jgi:siroheme synthase
MPAKTLPELVVKALAAGLDPAVPAVAVARATRADERVIAGSIGDLPALLAREAMPGPIVVLIGRVFADCSARALRDERPAEGRRHGQR